MSLDSVNDASFDEQVLRSAQPVIVDFWAQWCEPCKALMPLLDEVSREITGRARIVKLDVDESPESAKKYGIRGVPTFLVFNAGAVTGRHVGPVKKSQLLEMLASKAQEPRLPGNASMENTSRRARYEEIGLLTRERLGLSLPTAARRWPDREFIHFEGRRYQYRDIARWTDHVAGFLLRSGVGPGDKVLAQLPNSVELAILQFAIWRIGAIAVPVIPAYRRHEMVHILSNASPRAVAAAPLHGSRRYCDEIDEVLDSLGPRPALRIAVGATAPPSGWTPFPAFDDSAPFADDASFAPADSDQTVLILYTSGTTAAPKGAQLSGGGLLSHVHNVPRLLGLTEADVFVAGSPIAHVAGMSMGVLMPMSIGARTLILPAWNADLAVELIERERASFMSSAPIFLADIVDRYERGMSPGHRLRRYMAGGAAVAPTLIERAEAVGIKASRIYGMTETGGTCSMARTDDPLALRAHTEGRILFGTEVQIVDPDRRVLPADSIGEIRLRSPQLMLGYTDEAATARQIDAEGWFYPGDVGRVDAQGWLTMTGRIKDIINRGGEKFSAQDIEQALTASPGVASAAVVGAPDERFGEVVAAFLTLRPGTIWTGPEPLLAHLEAAKLAKQKMPVRWQVLDQLPMTATGKIQKQRLLEMLTKPG